MRERLAGDEEGAAQVDGLLEVPAFVVVSPIVPGDPDAGRVDEHVEATVRLEVLGDERARILVATSTAIAAASSSPAAASRRSTVRAASVSA